MRSVARGGEPSYLQVGASVTRYQSCTVDPRPSRVVHCPDLNACLVNEGRDSEPVHCNAVHYGYAIPVNVVPSQQHPDLAELVLDADRGLAPETVSYLLQHHPQLRESAMTTTANNRRGTALAEPEEDIAAIAKQISDHAEAIYQTWKARGLAPTEILNCHTNSTAADKFGSALTPKKEKSPTSPVVDLLSTPSSLNTNNLEQLVNNFVVEDKARIARQKTNTSKAIPSSIQFALQKFEKKAAEPSVKVGVKQTNQRQSDPLRNYSNTTPRPFQPKPSNISPYIMDTIETTFPDETDKSKTEEGGSGMTTWPLKNKTVGDTIKKLGGNLEKTESGTEYLDEVAKEEERLINALKTGIIIAEDPNSKRAKKGLKYGRAEEKAEIKEILNKVNVQSKVEAFSKAEQQNVVVRRSPAVRTPGGSVPHPELRTRSAPNTVANPVRPFLTRGSVAERVLIFEKCPTELIMEKRGKNNSVNSWRNTSVDVQAKAQNYSRDSLSSTKSGPPPHTTLQRHAKANRSLLIPRFHFPLGKPGEQAQVEMTTVNLRQLFLSFPNQQATKEHFAAVTKACGCPLYWKAPLFIACGGEKLGYVELNTIIEYWRNLCSTCHDPASRFLRIASRSSTRQYLLPEDLMGLVQDVVDTHPGLTFLKEAQEFHSRYVHTVISRIYYCVNQSWSGQITLPELRRSDFLRVVETLEREDDINQVTQYFSYEHFYVIYCKFWELDRDHDLFIDKNDLARHSDHGEYQALSSRLIDRIFSGTVTRGKMASQLNGSPDAKMSYTEFVWFLLAEEDKQHPRAIEYWFRCMDLDGDGYLSMYELEYFYDEQLQRMEAIGIECLPFEDCLCQMLDMIRPSIPDKISLSDLKRCKMTPIFFDTFFNLEKYLDHEQRDPFASQRDHDTEDNENEQMSDWDRYAAEEYELLVAEEGGNDNHDDFSYEDILSPNLDNILSEAGVGVVELGGRVGEGSDDSSSDYAGDSDDCSL
ncbi:uncharacterized protein LOC128991453 isoform X3 [Macrosteles quadrilineatus]|uniref:uncharacterized protein LOC128991453 isoform X3 n=1 Tax=Macrosteles quadrilineatus TaxID=74068 RepID=UPI0023E1CCE4|nr:uncharacterized protein LOC128991453 isoform X3 [Macrosteles quadrilineatus]